MADDDCRSAELEWDRNVEEGSRRGGLAQEYLRPDERLGTTTLLSFRHCEGEAR
jgi:hypothetical protein